MLFLNIYLLSFAPTTQEVTWYVLFATGCGNRFPLLYIDISRCSPETLEGVPCAWSCSNKRDGTCMEASTTCGQKHIHHILQHFLISCTFIANAGAKPHGHYYLLNYKITASLCFYISLDLCKDISSITTLKIKAQYSSLSYQHTVPLPCPWSSLSFLWENAP